MGRVAFSGVSFAYPTRSDVQVLQDFNLTVEPNQTVALVGTSGSGAVVVLCCLLRLGVSCVADVRNEDRDVHNGRRDHYFLRAL
jgi:ABC-type bacteriocin/lantibiotic exporter with double-glycine peptidase domain